MKPRSTVDAPGDFRKKRGWGFGERREMAVEVGNALANADYAPRFAPEFDVYVLPPDAVLFISESRKIALRGSAYVSIANLIDGGKSRTEIEGVLAGRHSPALIAEAFARLKRQGLLLERGEGLGAFGAFFSSLGVVPELARERLASLPVFFAGGAEPVESAFERLGGCIVHEKEAGALLVYSSDDYLDDALEGFNQTHLRDGREWMLVKLTGAVPLIGPSFSAGHSPCWKCLSHRMGANQEVKTFLKRAQNVRPVARSEFRTGQVSELASHFAALELA